MDGSTSILTSIKGMLDIDSSDTNFDNSIIININSVLMILTQLGVGPTEGYFITNNEQTWNNFLGERKDLEAIKTYIFLKVKLLFDPPTISSVLDAIQRQIDEFEWRLNVQAEMITPAVPI